MKSVKVFLLAMVLLYIGLFIFDYLKAVTFPLLHPYHSKIIFLKTVFMVLGGIGIMKLTLEYRVFKIFISIYAVLWIIYYAIKLIANLRGDQSSTSTFSSANIMLFYLYITQLLTPFPFFFFWMINRVFSSTLINRITNK